MSGETPITVVGNMVAEPELKFIPSGAAVANFTVASTPRKFNKQSNEFEDGETLFMRCNLWREAAENAVQSLTRGTRVVVTGVLVQRNWEDKETGAKRSVMEMTVDEIGPSLKYATAQVTKVQKGQQGGQQGGDQYGGDFTGHQQPQGAGGWGNQQQQPPQWGGPPQQGQQPQPQGNSGPLQPPQQAPQGGGWQQAPQGQQPPQQGQAPYYGDEPVF